MKLREKRNLDICKGNGLKYNILSNIVEETSTKAQIRATLEIIAKTVIGTLGPYGSTTLIQDREQKHLISKDGYDLINRLSFENEVSRTILQLVRQIASNQVLSVGDGSTSAIVVANALYSALTDPGEVAHFRRIAPKDISFILNDISEFVEKELKAKSIKLNDKFEFLDQIATIATNNDQETGKFISDIYKKIGKYGFISTDVLGKNEKDDFEIKQGIEWGRGYIDPLYGKGFENERVIFDMAPRVFLFNGNLTYDDIQPIMFPLIQEALNQEEASLLIVATSYDDDVKNFLNVNRQKHLQVGNKSLEMKFVPVDIDNITERSRHDLEDLAVLAKCEIFDKQSTPKAEISANPNKFIGSAQKVIVTKKNTQVIFPKESSSENKEKKIKEISTKLEELLKIEEPNKEEDFDIFECRRRISNMTNSTAIIKVGGKTLSERMSRERLIEDAIFACKSAIEHGYIPGGNIMVPKILLENRKYLATMLKTKYSYLPIEELATFFGYFIDLISSAFLESYKNVLENSYLSQEDVKETIKKCLKEEKFYNLKTHEFEDIDKTSVINSVQTDVEIMKTTISIVSLLSTSNQILTLNLCTTDALEEKAPEKENKI